LDYTHFSGYCQWVLLNKFRGEILEDITNRLKELRLSKNITQKQLAEIINLSYSGYQYIEYGKKQPILSNLIKLANYFEVSLDYLVGRTDDPKLHTLDEK